MDDVSLAKLSFLHPAIRYEAYKAYNEAVLATPVGVHPFITSTYRSFQEQAAIYAQGRTKPGKIVTNSKAGQSYHNYGLALDFVLKINGKVSWELDNNWMIVVNCFMERGFLWGGEFRGKFKDYPHFEKTFGYNWRQLIVLHDRKIFYEGTTYIDLDL